MYRGIGATVNGSKVTTHDGIVYDLASAGTQIDMLNDNLTSVRNSAATAKTVAMIGIPAALLVGWLIGRG